MDRSVEQKTSFADEQIIDMYWNRSEQAIQETDYKYGKYLFTIAYNILYDSMDCEECKNDTYLRVWNAIPPTRPLVFQAFLTTIMRNTAIDHYKEKTSKKRIPSELLLSMEDMNETLHGNQPMEEIYEAEEVGRYISIFVQGLSERQQYIFMGRYYMADPVEDLAEDLGVSIQTVYRELDKIKKGLKKHLEKNGVYV